MAELKPCPFCGSKAEHWYCSFDGKHISDTIKVLWGMECNHHMIKCSKCGIRTKVYATNKGCFNAWQRRADDGK